MTSPAQSRVLPDSPHLQWFEEFGKCRCGKAAAGILRGTRNESYGPHCKACATKRLKASERARSMQQSQQDKT